MKKKITIIGSGFSSLSAACYLAKSGFAVSVYEKNDQIGGRAQVLKKDGFQFDMGPSFYWMPDVFESFFRDFGKEIKDYIELEKLSPGYQVYFQDSSSISISDKLDEIIETFEKEEKGSGKELQKFIAKAEKNYDVAIKDLVYKPGVSLFELVSLKTVSKLNLFLSNISREIRRKFKNDKLVKILEFPVLFLGAKPQNTPAFYNFMNYADFSLGTWYPKGGMYKVVEALKKLGEELGVEYHSNAEVNQIVIDNGVVTGVNINNRFIASDVVLSGADYHHTESLLEQNYRSYSEEYWESKTFAPSALLFYVGFNKKLKNISHHTLFFDEDFDDHAKEIYDKPSWPKSPLFYASFPSVTDTIVAPEGKEAATFLIPLAPGLTNEENEKEKYLNIILERIEKHTGQELKGSMLFSESYTISDFKKDYNSYKGNAYGMANTLLQTAFLRPKIKSKKLENLFFTGQLTVPGPGVPPALISGKIAANQIINKTQ